MIRFISSAIMALITSVVIGGIMSFASAGILLADWWLVLIIAAVGLKFINILIALACSYLGILNIKIQGGINSNSFIPFAIYLCMIIAVPLCTVLIYIYLFNQEGLPGGFSQFLAGCVCAIFIFPNLKTLILMEWYKMKYAHLGFEHVYAATDEKLQEKKEGITSINKRPKQTYLGIGDYLIGFMILLFIICGCFAIVNAIQ